MIVFSWPPWIPNTTALAPRDSLHPRWTQIHLQVQSRSELSIFSPPSPDPAFVSFSNIHPKPSFLSTAFPRSYSMPRHITLNLCSFLSSLLLLSCLWSISILKATLVYRGPICLNSSSCLVLFLLQIPLFLHSHSHTFTNVGLPWLTGPLGPVLTWVCWSRVSLWVPAESPSAFGRKLPLFSNSGLCPEKQPWVGLLPALWFHVIPSSSRWARDISVDNLRKLWPKTAEREQPS